MELAKCELVLWKQHHTAEEQEQSNEWEIMGHRADVLQTLPEASSVGKVYSEFHCVVMVRRYYRWYIWNVFGLMNALVLVSWLIFILPVFDKSHTEEEALCSSRHYGSALLILCAFYILPTNNSGLQYWAPKTPYKAL